MVDFLYPHDLELREIAQTLIPRVAAGRLVFDAGFFPIVTSNTHLLEWEQQGVPMGLQQPRGLNGSPWVVKPLGGQRYQVEPGVYGEYQVIDERELTTRRQWGQLQGPIAIDDLVMRAQTTLLQRRYDRIEKIVWDLLIAGLYQVFAPSGALLHADTFTTQTFAAGVPWATVATATPLADLRAVQLLSRGYSVDFGAGARAYMNRTTLNNMLMNGNQADLYGRRTSGLATINSPADLNAILLGDDLPTPVVYEQGYVDEGGVFRLFIPNNKVIVVGRRTDGAAIGEYRMTRNVNNPGMAPGAYTRVVDDPDQVPRSVVVHDGHNGGPCLFYPSAIVVMTV